MTDDERVAVIEAIARGVYEDTTRGMRMFEIGMPAWEGAHPDMQEANRISARVIFGALEAHLDESGGVISFGKERT